MGIVEQRLPLGARRVAAVTEPLRRLLPSEKDRSAPEIAITIHAPFADDVGVIHPAAQGGLDSPHELACLLAEGGSLASLGEPWTIAHFRIADRA